MDLKYLEINFTFLNYLKPSEKEYLLKNIKYIKYKKNDIVHDCLNNCNGVILVQSGELRTYILSESGKEATLYRLQQKDICTLSASCIFENINFDIHIDAQKDSTIFLIDTYAFSKLCKNNVYIENFFLKSTLDKFSKTLWAIEQILFVSFDKRLALFLLKESNKNKSDQINLTHEEIAKYLATAREVVSRMLKYFEQEGLLDIYRGKIIIKDKNKLKKLTL